VRQDRKQRPSVPRGISSSPRQSPAPEYQTKKLRTRPVSAERVSSDRELYNMDVNETNVRSLPPISHSFRPQSAPPVARRTVPRSSADNSRMLDYPISDIDITFPEGAESPQLEYFGGFDTPEPTLMDTEDPMRLASTEAPRFIQSLASVRCAEGDQVQLRARISGFPKPRVSAKSSTLWVIFLRE
jgi:hypothetical protein